MEDSLTVVDKCVHHLAGSYIPHTDRRVRGAGNDYSFIVLQTEDTTRVTVEDTETGQRISVPHLDCIVPQPTDDLGVIVLQTIDTFGVFAPTVDALKVVLSTSPVVLYRIDVLEIKMFGEQGFFHVQYIHTSTAPQLVISCLGIYPAMRPLSQWPHG